MFDAGFSELLLLFVIALVMALTYQRFILSRDNTVDSPRRGKR